MKSLTFKPIIILAIAIAFTACTNHGVKFDKEKWKTGDGINYTMRDNVLNDLLANYKLVGMNYKDVIRLLGKPDETDSLKTSYQIINTLGEYNPKNKPVYKKYLEFYFSKDSVVTRTNVYEHTDKKGPYSVLPQPKK